MKATTSPLTPIILVCLAIGPVGRFVKDRVLHGVQHQVHIKQAQLQASSFSCKLFQVFRRLGKGDRSKQREG